MGYMAWGTKNSSVKAHSHSVVSEFFNRLDVEIGMHFYRPQQQLRKGYVFMGVWLSTRVEVYTPRQSDISPWADTPSGRQTPSWADTPWQTPRQQTATAADGTHPTGMHSCF